MAYKASVDQLTGDKVMLFIHEGEDGGGKDVPIAYGTSCSVEVSAETIDTTSKMSGNWKEFLTGQLSYTISSDSLVSFTEGHYSFKKLKALMKARLPIQFKVGQWQKSGEEYTVSGSIVEGEAVITQLTMTSGQGSEICTSSFSMTGLGELKDGAEELTVASAPANEQGDDGASASTEPVSDDETV